MKIGITLDEDKGLESQVSQHFGQCKYFLIADVQDGEIKNYEVVKNNSEHGGGGCAAVSEITQYNITHVISGGMGMGAKNKFAAANIEIFCGIGTAKNSIESLLKNKLSDIETCKENHEHHH